MFAFTFTQKHLHSYLSNKLPYQIINYCIVCNSSIIYLYQIPFFLSNVFYQLAKSFFNSSCYQFLIITLNIFQPLHFNLFFIFSIFPSSRQNENAPKMRMETYLFTRTSTTVMQFGKIMTVCSRFKPPCSPIHPPFLPCTLRPVAKIITKKGERPWQLGF